MKKKTKSKKKKKPCNDCKERELIVTDLVTFFSKLQKKYGEYGYQEYLAMRILSDFFIEQFGTQRLKEIFRECLGDYE